MIIDRQNRRKQSYAKVLLDGSIPAYMRNISLDGFRIYSPAALPYKKGSVLVCRVIPSNQNANPFDIKGEIRWIHSGEQGDGVMGFRIRSFENAEGEALYNSLHKHFSEQ